MKKWMTKKRRKKLNKSERRAWKTKIIWERNWRWTREAKKWRSNEIKRKSKFTKEDERKRELAKLHENLAEPEFLDI